MSARSSARKVSRISRSLAVIRSSSASSWWASSAREGCGAGLARQDSVLLIRRFDGLLRYVLGTADLAMLKPRGQPFHAGASQCGGGLIVRQHDDRALGAGVVEGALQGWADSAQQVAHSVDESDPVRDQVAPDGGQQAEGADLFGRDRDCAEVPPDSGHVRDDQGVLRVRLAFAAVALGGTADAPARHVGDLLAVGGEQDQQQRRGLASQVDCPPHFVCGFAGGGDEAEDF